MFRTLAGVELYAVAQGASVVLFFLLAYGYSQGKRRLLHAGALTLFYMLANFVAAKFFFDLRQDPQAVRLVNYFRPQHYSTADSGAGRWRSCLSCWPTRFCFGSIAWRCIAPWR